MKNNFLKKNYGWVVVFTGVVAMALVYGTIVNSIGLFVIPLTRTYGYSVAAISAIVSFRSVGSIIGANVIAYVIKKSGPKMSMICSAFLLVTVTYFFSQGNQLWQFYACAIIIGIAVAGTTLIPISVLINNWFEDGKRSFSVSIAYMGSGLGGLVLNPFLNSVIQKFGWSIAFMAIGILIAIIYIPIVGIFTVSTPEKIGALRIGQKGDVHERERRGWPFSKAVKVKYFVGSAIALAMVSAAGAAIVFYIVSYYVGIGFSASKAAMVAGVSVGCVAVGKIIIGWLGDKFSPAAATKVGLFSLTVSFLALCMVEISDILLVPIVVVYGLGVGSITVLSPTIINYFFGDKEFTKMMGLITMCTGTGVAIGPLLLGIIIDLTASYKIGFVILSILTCFAGVLLTFLFYKYDKKCH